MDLLERYLQAVGQHLPASTKEDVLAELRANLQAEIDDRADELGRPLTDHETADVLLAHGQPELVAGRYLPQRSLIGPAIFPIYRLTLRRAFPLVLLVYTVAHAIPLLTATDGRALAHGIAGAVMQLIPTLILFWFWVTAVFAILEAVNYHYAAIRGSGRAGLAEDPVPVVTFARARLGIQNWDPMKLPAVTPQGKGKPKSFATRVVELALHCLWLAYVLMIPYHPFLIIGPGTLYLSTLSVTFAPVWHTFFVVIISLLSVQLLMKVLALRNGAQPWQVPLELVTRVIGAVAIGILAFAKTFFIPSGIAANLNAIAATTKAMNIGFRIVLLFVVAGILVDLWKLARRRIPAQVLAF